MKNFTCVKDLGDLQVALKEAFEIKEIDISFVSWEKTKHC